MPYIIENKNIKEFVEMPVAKWTKYSEQELNTMVKNSNSYADFAEQMGYARTGGSGIRTAKDVIKKYNFDISHFGEHWVAPNKNQFDYSRFKYGNAIKSANMIKALVYLRGHQCEKCSSAEWLGQPIILEVHHKDGDHLNNELDNLELLCPNCHALTENWRGKNMNNKKEPVSEEQFVKALQENKSVRQALLSLGLTGAGANYSRAYELANKYNIQHLIK